MPRTDREPILVPRGGLAAVEAGNGGPSDRRELLQSSGIVMDWPTAEALRQSQALGKEIAKQVRSLANLLYPRLLDEAGLTEAIRWYVKGFEQRSGFKVSMELPSRFQRMVQEVERTLFRVVQEALTNVHRHSGGESTEIRLEEDRYAVQLEIKDDGHGMPPRIVEGGGQEPPPGVGILGMTERVRLLGGRVEIQSGTWGTRVTERRDQRAERLVLVSGRAEGPPTAQGGNVECGPDAG